MKCSFSEEIAGHLASLKEELEWYFPEAPSYEQITNPFSVIPHDLAVGTLLDIEIVPLLTSGLTLLHHTLPCCFTVVNIFINVGM